LGHLELGTTSKQPAYSCESCLCEDRRVRRDFSELLVRMVSTRLAAFERRSTSEILLAARGLPLQHQDLNDITSRTSKEEYPLAFHCQSPIRSLKVLIKLKGNQDSTDRLTALVGEVDLSGLED